MYIILYTSSVAALLLVSDYELFVPSFPSSDGGGGGLSEPPVSLSTFLLVHLPFSTQAKHQEQQQLQQKWPYEDDDSE